MARVRLTWVTAGYGWVGLVFPIVGGGAGLFRRATELRRADDGGGRLQPGAAVAALVRRQHRRDRRLAGDAAAGDELPPGAARPRRRRGRRRPHRAGEDAGGPLHARRGPGGDPARLHRPRPAAPRGRAGRARAHPRQAGLGAHQLLPGDRRALERRLGPHRRAPRRRGRLSDAAAVPAVRVAARGADARTARRTTTTRCAPR